MRILIVCSGNTCRSPMAEVILREELSRAGITDVEVRSAGILSTGGEAMSPYSSEALATGGYDRSLDFRSSSIERIPVADYDLVLCMTKSQVIVMNQRFTGIREKTSTLAQTEEGKPRDISDPFWGPQDEYHKTFKEIHDAVMKLVVELKGRK